MSAGLDLVGMWYYRPEQGGASIDGGGALFFRCP